MGIIICPGLVDAAFTASFWPLIQESLIDERVVSDSDRATPNDSVFGLSLDCPVYSPQHVYAEVYPYLVAHSTSERWIWIAFSAGVVGGIGAARRCHAQFPLQRFIALDAWGVVLQAPFPVYHLSHDWLTHISVTSMNRLSGSFYADPAVSHLNLWRSPHTVTGREYYAGGAHSLTTAAAFIAHLVDSAVAIS